MKITRVDDTKVEVPFNERIEEDFKKRGLYRINHIYQVHTDEGLVGLGELPDYLARLVTEEEKEKVIGTSPFEHLMDDTPAGLSMACFDLAGKATGLPAHAFMGTKVHDKIPIAWWSIDMPPDLWAAEAKGAYEAGYRVHKIKARPWYDLIDQVAAMAEAVPYDDYRLRVDPNGSFEQPYTALEFERLLEPYNIESFESPIPQERIDGYVHLRHHLRTPVTLHMGMGASVLRALRHQICDAFIIGYPDQRAKYTIREGNFAQMAEGMPVWLQMVGMGITDAYVCHVACTMPNATWSAITLSGLRVTNLLKQPHKVTKGFLDVPEGPGFGVDLDLDAFEKYRVD